MQAKFVELGVTILQAPPTDAAKNLRDWATEVLNRYSGVPLDKATRDDLIASFALPAAPAAAAVIPIAIRMYCTCNAAQTLCFLEKRECENHVTNIPCSERLTTEQSFNVFDSSTWSASNKKNSWSRPTCRF